MASARLAATAAVAAVTAQVSEGVAIDPRASLRFRSFLAKGAATSCATTCGKHSSQWARWALAANSASGGSAPECAKFETAGCDRVFHFVAKFQLCRSLVTLDSNGLALRL